MYSWLLHSKRPSRLSLSPCDHPVVPRASWPPPAPSALLPAWFLQCARQTSHCPQGGGHRNSPKDTAIIANVTTLYWGACSMHAHSTITEAGFDPPTSAAPLASAAWGSTFAGLFAMARGVAGVSAFWPKKLKPWDRVSGWNAGSGGSRGTSIIAGSGWNCGGGWKCTGIGWTTGVGWMSECVHVAQRDIIAE